MKAHNRQSGGILGWLYGEEGIPWGTQPSDYDREAVAATLRHLGRFFGPGRYFRIDGSGMERIPEPPVMIVSNHSGGTSVPDAWGFMVLWYGHFGLERPIHAMAHEMVFSTALTGPYFAKRGALQASRLLAQDVLRSWGRDLLVMPGGDRDTWRPYKDRYQVQFGGRTGYARTAIKAGVPIVPLAHAGAHETLVVLTDGQRLARWLRLPEIARANIFPVHLSLPYGLAVGPLPHIPLPARLRYRFGDPIPPPVLVDPTAEPPAAAVEALDRAVRRSMQALLDGLADERAVLLERVRDRMRHAVDALGIRA